MLDSLIQQFWSNKARKKAREYSDNDKDINSEISQVSLKKKKVYIPKKLNDMFSLKELNWIDYYTLHKLFTYLICTSSKAVMSISNWIFISLWWIILKFMSVDLDRIYTHITSIKWVWAGYYDTQTCLSIIIK